MIFSHLKGTKKFKVWLNSSRNCSVWFVTFGTELTLFYIELPENCTYLNQSELSSFFYISYYYKNYGFSKYIHDYVQNAFITLIIIDSLKYQQS